MDSIGENRTYRGREQALIQTGRVRAWDPAAPSSRSDLTRRSALAHGGAAIVAPAALAVLACVATGVVVLAPTASAHPLGAPQTVRISAAGQHVAVQWAAAPDDLTALGLHIGAIGASRTFVYNGGVLVPEESDPSTSVLLADSAQLPEYLLRHIQVRQDGDTCPGSVTRAKDLAEAGVRLRFDCPEKVTRVRVSVTTLTDLHPGYRTAARTDSGQRAIYTQKSSVHVWQLDDASTDAKTLPAPLGALVAAAVAAVVWSRFVVRRRRTTRSRVAP